MTYRLRGNLHSHTYKNELLHTSPSLDKTVRVESYIEQNKCFSFYRWELTDSTFPFRYTQVLGGTMTSPLCGMLPMYVSTMCFDSLSAITVKYVLQFLTISGCYIPQTLSVLTSFFSSKTKYKHRHQEHLPLQQGPNHISQSQALNL